MGATSAPMNSNSILVYVDDESGTAGGQRLLGSQTGVTFNENRETIDTTTKAAFGSSTFIGGKYTSTCSATALYIDDDDGQLEMKANLRSNTEVIIHRYEPQGTNATGGSVSAPTGWQMADAVVTSISEDFQQDSLGTISIEFAITGTWTTSTGTAA